VSADLLEVRDLHLTAPSGRAVVRGVSFAVPRDGALGIVGESGSGKSLTCRAVLGILPAGVVRTGGTVRFDGLDLTTLPARAWLDVRGPRIGAVFQDPGSYLNPSVPVGRQLAEVLRVRGGLRRAEARTRAVELLEELGLHRPALVARLLPHELSGGMLQRVLLAVALSLEPELLIADEATTALDATVQAEVLDLLEYLRTRRSLALVVVSHDLGVVARSTEHVVVLRDGEVVESGPTRAVLTAPTHPYTRSLVADHEAHSLERFLDQEALHA
jgi:ABC-type glutathione transport system ATPase component